MRRRSVGSGHSPGIGTSLVEDGVVASVAKKEIVQRASLQTSLDVFKRAGGDGTPDA